MEHPNLMIQNVLTWEPIWGLDPPVKYLTKIKETNEIEKIDGKISVYNSLSVHDRLLSVDDSSSFVYLSTFFGLQFNYGSYYGIRSLSILDNNFYINC